MKINYEARAILSGLSMPALAGNRAKVIAKGNLADSVIKGLQLSEADYYGLVIAFRGGVLWKKEMRELALRPDFPN
jgi:hypothetical protein